MIKLAIRLVALVGACVLSFLLWTASRIPNSDDVDVANAVAQAIIAEDGHFVPRPQADASGAGQALYAHPGAGGHPTLVVYEVLDAGQRARIVAAARKALAPAHAHSVTLSFYERQNVTHFEGGGVRRGPERLIETVRVPSDT